MAATAYGSADKLPLTGGTVTGPLVLAGSPPLQVATGAANGAVMTSDASGNATWTKTGTDWLNAKSYGADSTGATDTASAITAAITAASAAGGGTVYLPAGTYLVNSALTVPSKVVLVGAGTEATTVKKNFNGTLLSLSGPSTDTTGATHCKYAGVQSLTVNGNSKTGLVFQCYYADNLRFRDVKVASNADVVLDTAEFWDSHFYNIVIESCGSSASNAQTPNFLIRDSAAASGFGNSTDSVNQIHFTGCRWEGFRTGAVWVQQGLGNAAGPNSIWFTDCKMETSTVNGGPHLLVDANCREVDAKHLYCYSGGFTGGYSTAQDLITYSGQFGTLDDVLLSNGGVATVASGITLNSPSAGQVVVLENVRATWGTAPTGATVTFGTATGGFKVTNVTANSGTLFGGTVPSAPTGSGNIQSFTGSGTWTKPPGAAMVTAVLISGGGGGGSGAVEASGTVASGGGGGGGGSYSLVTLPASVLGSTETVTVGGGGAGGAAVGTGAAVGNAGGNGGNSIFKSANFAVANWGNGGAGGLIGAASGGSAGSGSFSGAPGASSAAAGGAGNGSIGAQQGPTGGGSGAGMAAAPASAAGGAGGGVSVSGGVAGGTAGASGGGAGGAGQSAGANFPIAGTGGGGGGTLLAGNGGAGGAGGNYGAGGGGGAGATSTHNSGAGGAGAPGIVVVITTTAT